MLKKHLLFTVLFLGIFLLNLYAAENSDTLILFVKPFIALSLAIYLMLQVGIKTGFNRLVFGGLIFSLTGDCFLMFESANSNNFLFGLASFLIAHIAYSMAFFRDFKNDPYATKFYGHLTFFMMGVFSMSFYTLIRNYLNEFRIPVLAYMFVISVMIILAAYRHRRVNLISFRLIFWGAFCFVASDSILAYNKFAEPFDYAGLLIMASYMIAQYLITMGTVERRITIRQGEKESEGR